MTDHESPTGEVTPIYDELVPEQQFSGAGVAQSQGWLLAIDRERCDLPLDAYPLVLCPAKDGETFTVFKASERLQIPRNAVLECAPDVTRILDGDYQYNVLECRLHGPAEIDAVPSERLLTFPPELTGTTVRETTSLNVTLWESLVDAHAAQQPDDESDPDFGPVG